MTAIYLVDVAGDGITVGDSYRVPPAMPEGWKILMIDTVARLNGKTKPTVMKALVVHPSNTVAGQGVRRLLSAASGAALVTAMKSTGLNGQERNVVESYATAANLDPVDTTTWWTAVSAIAAEVNPGVDVEQTILSVG